MLSWDVLKIIFGKLDFVSQVRFRSVFRRCEIVDIDERMHDKITPEVLGWFPKLEYISLDTNSKIGISDIVKMTNLKRLFIEDLNQEIEKISYLTKLQELCLVDMPNVTDKHFCNLTQLKKLYINECPEIDGEYLQHLTNLKSLTFYPPYYNIKRITKIHDLSHQTNLTELSIYAELTNTEQLSKLQNLRKLDLRNNCAHINYLQQLPNLRHLIITNCQTWIHIDLLNLQRLTLINSILYLDNLQEFKNLKELELSLSLTNIHYYCGKIANLPIKKLILNHNLTESLTASLSNSSFKIQIKK